MHEKLGDDFRVSGVLNKEREEIKEERDSGYRESGRARGSA